MIWSRLKEPPGLRLPIEGASRFTISLDPIATIALEMITLDPTEGAAKDTNARESF